MILSDIEYALPCTRSENCILINVDNWEQDDSLIQRYNVNNKKSVSYISRVLDIGYTDTFKTHIINKGDLVALTRKSSRVASLRRYAFPEIDGEYANVHIMQIIGRFKDNKININNLELFYNKLILEKVENSNSILYTTDDKDKMIACKVTRVGTHNFNDNWEKVDLRVSVGMVVLLKDNSTTNLVINGKNYLITEEENVIGYFDGDLSLENFKTIGENILLEEFSEEKINDSILFTPIIDLDKEDISEVYKDYKFKVIRCNSTKIKEGNVIILNRDLCDYLTMNGKTYFVLNSTSNVDGIYV